MYDGYRFTPAASAATAHERHERWFDTDGVSFGQGGGARLPQDERARERMSTLLVQLEETGVLLCERVRAETNMGEH